MLEARFLTGGFKDLDSIAKVMDMAFNTDIRAAVVLWDPKKSGFMSKYRDCGNGRERIDFKLKEI